MTVKAAPITLSIQHLDHPAGLKMAFDGFWFWSAARAVFQVLAFAANLWSLVAVSKTSLAT